MNNQDRVAERPPTPVAPDRPESSQPEPRSGRRWRRLRIGLVLTASVGWLLYVLLHRLLSGRTPLWAPFDLMPPIAFIGIPVVLAALIPLVRPFHWRWLPIPVVAGLVGAGLSGINLATLWYTPPAAPPGAITVVAWNTEFWDQDWRGDGGHRADFYEFLHRLDADVYLLSEYLYSAGGDAMDGKFTGDMAVRIDTSARLAREFPGYQVAVAGEQITLSRLPIVSYHGLDLRGWVPAEQREIPADMRDFPDSYTTETLRTDIRLNGTVVSFYNTQILQPPLDWHLYRRASRDSNRWKYDRREASYRALRADIEANHNPVVLAGDLNTSPAMGILRLLPGKLVDHTRALSSLYPTTWLAGEFELWRLDRLLTTADLTVHRYELLDADGQSDHRPQRTVISLSTD
ncbi:endonuclease/exonuclease/phosphatase family protein [Rhizomonospora bruguierae]|uniref:endonuclease/exonuclease/phosphatase family protein n=1 Tax=Rhizomonospora bruguierae TaxID=1581705 RepID=UPI001BCFB0FB|nr:endonuclease/exonuclease/phosphatase family protein [Micromonospora sp. NBRC 107566]